MNTVICPKCHSKFSMYNYMKGKDNWGETHLEIVQKITNPDYGTIPVTLCRECEKKVIQFIFSSEGVKNDAVEPD